MLRHLVPAVSLLAFAATVAVAQPIDTDPCTTTVVDSSAENGFTIGAGQTEIEFCSLGEVPATSGSYNCLWGDYYHTTAHGSVWTALQSQPDSTFDWRLREDAAGEPGTVIASETIPATLRSPSIFPSVRRLVSRRYPRFPILELLRRLHHGARGRTLRSRYWSCALLRQALAGRFLSVDRSPTTLLRSCRVRSDATWEDCTTQDPNLRALGLGSGNAPIAGYGSSDRVVPGHSSTYTFYSRAYFTGPPLPSNAPGGVNTFRFMIEHDVPNPTVAHVHEGYPGLNGPIVLTFPDPESPIDLSNVTLTQAEIDALGANRLYIDIHTAAHPEGEVRGELIAAQPPLFADGVESGDTSAWSATQP